MKSKILFRKNIIKLNFMLKQKKKISIWTWKILKIIFKQRKKQMTFMIKFQN